jgi:hypothetical protein
MIVVWLSISGNEITDRSKQEAEKISQNEHEGSVAAYRVTEQGEKCPAKSEEGGQRVRLYKRVFSLSQEHA